VELARQAGNASAAATQLDELIAKFPDSDDAYNIAFQLYGPFGIAPDPGKSVKILERGIAARPSSTMIRNTYGYSLLNAGQYAEAVREFETNTRVAPHEPNPYDSLAEAYLVMGMADKAIEYYSRALTVDPRFSSAHNGRAWALAILGRYDEAIAEDPSDASIKSFILSRVGRYGEAASVALAGRRAEDKSASAQGSFSLLLTLFALEQRQYGRARQELRAADEYFSQMQEREQRPFRVVLDTMAGTVEVAAGRLDDAKSHLAALKARYNRTLVNENWWSKALEGEIALAEGRLQQAAGTFAAGEPPGRMWLNLLLPAMAILANNLPGRDGVARVKAAMGDLSGAIQAYRRLTSGDAQKWSAMVEPRYILQLARLLDRTGDRKAAELEYRRFLDLWSHADAGLPELSEARHAVERIREGASATGSVPKEIR
jgi:tetratricopeptide (TPR) repeat protein